ncbi:hypothetical protein ACO0K9_06660 [Undibacterium sp. Ji50W]|uniref:hypothetical protein n=1 Tax=Undibacterium sp. Ji50W TaxID=3413041 RepID=UPI003BF050B7
MRFTLKKWNETSFFVSHTESVKICDILQRLDYLLQLPVIREETEVKETLFWIGGGFLPVWDGVLAQMLIRSISFALEHSRGARFRVDYATPTYQEVLMSALERSN